MKARMKILAPVDGRNASMEAVRYLSRLSALSEEKVVIFHVYSPLPDYYWDMEGYADPLQYRNDFKEAVKWHQTSRTALQERLCQAKSILTQAGFSKDMVEIKLAERQVGFARDIIDEARNGYHFAVVGRSGINQLKPHAFGSVAVKLMQKIDFIPLVLVGVSPPHGKALIALDGSACANRVLKMIGTVLAKSNFDVSIFHVIRGDGRSDYLTIAKTRGEEILACARRQVGANKVTTKIVCGKKSRAEAIMEEAKGRGFGTIVLGRKGLNNAQCYYIGRVSNKVAQLAGKHAVWIGN
jgi:nucleotide-binding universal stress UspA family protein